MNILTDNLLETSPLYTSSPFLVEPGITAPSTSHFSESTMQAHPNAETPSFLPSKPVLTNPSLSLCFITIDLEKTGGDILHIQNALLKRMHSTQQAKYAEFMQKVEEASKKNKERSWWGYLHQFISLLVTTVSLVFGVSLIAEGAVFVGGFMISSGVLSITNYILEQTNTYNNWIDKLAEGDLEKRRKLAFILPAVIGTVGAVGSVIWSQLNLAAQAGVIIKTCFDLLKAGSNLKEGKLTYDASLIRADETEINHQIEWIERHQEELMQQITTMMKELSEASLAAAKAVEISIQTNESALRG